MVGRRPRPAHTADTQFFWDGARAGKLLLQQCGSCRRLRHPPGPMCPACGALRWEAIEASGRGVVYSFTVIHHPQLPGFEYPLVVALIELAEGVRLISNIVGVHPEGITIGMPVQAEFDVDGDLTVPQFRPAGLRPA